MDGRFNKCLEIYSSIFNRNLENNNFEVPTDTFDEFSFEELKSELEEIVNFSIISHKHLQDEIICPRIIKANKKLETETRQTDGYHMLMLGYARSPFSDLKVILEL